MATVFRARQVSVNRFVALKIIDLSANQEEREEFRKRFAQEATVVALLEHIHILPLYAYGIVDNEFAYLAMRLLRGGTLSDLMAKGLMPHARVADIFSQIASGLQYAHSKAVIHRDLKPSNILMDDAGNAYLSDFGLAKIVGSATDLTKSGNLVGTPTYVSPEQVRGETADARSDIYSLGILLYHMMTGRPPFELGETGIAALLYKHVEEAPLPPSLLNPTIPPAVEMVILTALEKEPDVRYQSAAEMAQALNAAMGRKPGVRNIIAQRTPRRLKMLRGNRRFMQRRLLVALALVLMLAAGVGAVIVARQPAATPPVQIVSGERGTLTNVTPTQQEIDAARARLGSNGFIAFLACELDSISQVTRAREMGDMAAAFELDYRFYNAANDPLMQIRQIEQARLEGAKAIILCPVDSDLLDDSIDSLQEGNIPLTYITLFDHPYGVKQDSSSSEIGLVVGRLAAQNFMDEGWDEARVVVFSYPGFPATEARSNAMEEGFREEVPEATFLERVPGYTQDAAYASTKQLLDAGADFNVILSINDAGAYGAIQALDEAGLAPDSVIIVSANAESFAQELIRQGRFLRGTVALNREESSQIAVDATVKMLAGSAVPEIVSYPPGDVYTKEVLEALGN
jgi:ABC-type sugar transport system substrate-binding protein